MGRLQMKEGEETLESNEITVTWPSLRSEKGQLFHALHDGCTGKRWKIEASCLFRLEIIHLTTLCNFHSFEKHPLGEIEHKHYPAPCPPQTTVHWHISQGDPGAGAEPPH